MDEEAYNQWNKKFRAAQSDLNNREEAVKQAMKSLEHEMELLGVTGVEDKLQDDVEKTIESLRQAGI